MAKESKATKAKTTAPKEVDLDAQIAEKQQDLIEAKRSLAAGDLLNPRVITHTRREIARLKTQQRQLVKKESN